MTQSLIQKCQGLMNLADIRLDEGIGPLIEQSTGTNMSN